ncbi:hypothetical protein COCSUDRAFT_60159 [Coccomyxa subellipsoidea C-169]|uniref:Uncharacterized protein n=1 Tax=Coccomyxa subellipsoidea (strain C-169) TaxID=574566 RepID=I0YJC4_COCSC|nr:hypothetical protein COCSUDRAFT_60159 [Coccomyxa subellipsoidea C-169]EIE18493.1 hypothetical protein COCSUDRAFT_60159 [Coccomyxa subellipsoidea C-169]|eukprot:XP_005643037.1 hypothetical protein COCSUDRAFT_60159 [Coccomyxa subellipsoidea C-169]
MASIAVFAVLVLMAAAMVAGRPLEASGDGSYADGDRAVERGPGRTLLAATDITFNEASSAHPDKCIMVCKSCSASDLTGVVVDSRGLRGFGSMSFHVWAFDAGTITNTGDGGLDNWQFKGCFDRPNPKLVNFKKC